VLALSLLKSVDSGVSTLVGVRRGRHDRPLDERRDLVLLVAEFAEHLERVLTDPRTVATDTVRTALVEGDRPAALAFSAAARCGHFLPPTARAQIRIIEQLLAAAHRHR